MTRTWSTRGAAAAAGVTRAMVRTAVEIGLVPNTDLVLADLVQMKANSFVRGIMFPGEQRAGHLSRVPMLERERQLVEAVTRIVSGNRREAVVFFHRTHVTVAPDTSALVTQTLAAASQGEPYVVLPVGAWLADIDDSAAVG